MAFAKAASPSWRRGARFGLYGLVLVGLAGGSIALVTDHRSVTLRIDGRQRSVRTSAVDVRGVLASAGITVAAHDLVAPDLSERVRAHSQIVVRRGHELTLSVDGQRRDVWVNAVSVDEALNQLGYSRNSYVSVSRAKRLDSGTTTLRVTRPKLLTIRADGLSLRFVSPGPTVRDAISDAGVDLGGSDQISVPAGSQVYPGEVITIRRVRHDLQATSVVTGFRTLTKPDPASFTGTSQLLTPGRQGRATATYEAVYVDGKLTSRTKVSTEIDAAPVDQVTAVGTKPLPPVPTAAQAQQIAAGLVLARGWGSEQQSCLISLWSKESGWRVNAANSSGAYGIPQALPGAKMSSAGPDWQTNAVTQITWGLNYIAGVYGSPCVAWSHSQSVNWY